MQLTQPQIRRQTILESYLQEISFEASEGHSAEIPNSISLRGHELKLGAWERNVLRRARKRAEAREDPSESKDSRGAAEEAQRASAMLVECIAYQALCREQLDRFECGPMPAPDELPAFLDGMVNDVAVGLALAEELQRDLNWLVGRGRVGEAKTLTGFRNKIVQCVSLLKERVGAEAISRAEDLVEALLSSNHGGVSEFRVLLKEAEPESPESFKREIFVPKRGPHREETDLDHDLEPKPAPRSRNRIGRLVLYFGVLVLIWMIVVLPGLLRPSLPVLKPAHFAHLEQVRRITARPPSLYVSLDGSDWKEMPRTSRVALLEEIARISSEAGYSGFLATTTDGAPVGRWLKKRGVSLITPPKHPS